MPEILLIMTNEMSFNHLVNCEVHQRPKKTNVTLLMSPDQGGALLMHEAQVVKLWVSFAERHPETLIDNEPDHLRHQSLNLRVAYAQGD